MNRDRSSESNRNVDDSESAEMMRKEISIGKHTVTLWAHLKRMVYNPRAPWPAQPVDHTIVIGLRIFEDWQSSDFGLLRLIVGNKTSKVRTEDDFPGIYDFPLFISQPQGQVNGTLSLESLPRIASVSCCNAIAPVLAVISAQELSVGIEGFKSGAGHFCGAVLARRWRFDYSWWCRWDTNAIIDDDEKDKNERNDEKLEDVSKQSINEVELGLYWYLRETVESTGKYSVKMSTSDTCTSHL